MFSSGAIHLRLRALPSQNNKKLYKVRTELLLLDFRRWGSLQITNGCLSKNAQLYTFVSLIYICGVDNTILKT